MPTFEPATGLQPVATTGVNGVALINGTANILSWTAPNDGNIHSAVLTVSIHITVAETGGGVTFGSQNTGGAGVLIDGAAGWMTVNAGGSATGMLNSQNPPELAVGPGSTIYLYQNSALTLGTAKIFATIWAA